MVYKMYHTELPNKNNIVLIMTKDINNIILLGFFLIILCTVSSCISVFDSGVAVGFKNCTSDTLYIGASNYDHIDSVNCQLFPHYNIIANSTIDTTNISLWEDKIINQNGSTIYIPFRKNHFVYPDSICVINANCLFEDTDTCYFFLVKWNDAKNYSWDEIRAKKLYKKWITTKNKDGDCDRNIRYDYQQSVGSR